MDTIFADQTISVSEFKKNPGKAIAEADGKPLAVLKNNRPGFYAVPPELFERIADVLEDLMFADVVEQRMKRGDFVDIELEEL